MTESQRAAMQQALAFIQDIDCDDNDRDILTQSQCESLDSCRNALLAALAEPVLEPVANIEKRVVWVAYTNQDLTEGRGCDIPIAVCDIEITAHRLAKKRYVQCSDGPVRSIELIKIGREWYAPQAAFTVVGPTKEDISLKSARDARKDAASKAKALGLTDSDLAALGVQQ